MTILVGRNYAKHTPLRNQLLTIRRRHRLTLFRWHIRNLRLIRATGSECAAHMGHTPDALLICNKHKAVPVGEAVRGLEVVSVAFNVVRLAVTILVPQQRQISGLLLSNNHIVIRKDEQSARMLEAYDIRRNGEALHHPRRLSCIW